MSKEIEGLILTNPLDLSLTQQEIKDFCNENISELMVAGVPAPVIINGYMIAIWTLLIAHAGGSAQGSVELMKVNTSLMAMGPKVEALLQGHRLQ